MHVHMYVCTFHRPTNEPQSAVHRTCQAVVGHTAHKHTQASLLLMLGTLDHTLLSHYVQYMPRSTPISVPLECACPLPHLHATFHCVCGNVGMGVCALAPLLADEEVTDDSKCSSD